MKSFRTPKLLESENFQFLAKVRTVNQYCLLRRKKCYLRFEIITLIDMQIFDIHQRIGILGGGQLGKMLTLAAANWHAPIYILEKSNRYSAGRLATRFVQGDFKDYEDVYFFGKHTDILTIEIEHVNTAALHQLVKEGVIVHPAPDKLDIIKDKGLQKQFYAHHALPTSSFQLFEDAAAIQNAIDNQQLRYPFVQKSRTAGYDGKGVAVIRSKDDPLMKTASLVEPLVDIDKEIAVIVARNPNGQIEAFPPVEMLFHPTANLVEFLACPARISEAVVMAAIQLAKQTIQTYDICGLLAVEMFLTKSGELLINEVAPRPHNSGHHTIDSCYTSQFEQHIRAITNLPLGSTKLTSPAVMLNLLGEAAHTGKTDYLGLKECLSMEGVYVHLYGKATTRPFRKMGHVTIVNEDMEKAIEIAGEVKKRLKVVAQ
ncbi:MAG: 5-(carboxyamino)imidazole ribonucleotide synthase [Bacteroidota bacterium]